MTCMCWNASTMIKNRKGHKVANVVSETRPQVAPSLDTQNLGRISDTEFTTANTTAICDYVFGLS